jgi:hypothetical protein
VAAKVSVFDFGIFLLRIAHVEISGKTSIGVAVKAGDEVSTLLKFMVQGTALIELSMIMAEELLERVTLDIKAPITADAGQSA